MMEKAYLYRAPDDYPDKAFGFYDREISPDEYLYIKGKPVEPPSLPLVYNVEGQLKDLAVYDNIANNSCLLLAGPRLQMIFNACCPDDVQYLETLIRAKDGTTDRYKAVNITHEIDAIDYDRSVCTYMKNAPQAILSIKHLVLKSNCLGHHLIARFRDYHAYILVSEKLRQICLKANIKGIYFKTIAEFNNFDFSEV